MNIAIVTGASSGLGEEYVRCLAEQYDSVEGIWVIARREDRLEQLKARFPQKTIRPIPLDLTQNESYAALRDLLEQEKPINEMLEKLFNTVVSNYNWKGYELSEGEFLRLGEPFRAADYGNGGYAAMFDVLDPDSFFLILVDVKNGFIRNTPTFDQMADENQQFTKPVDFSKTYIVGCVFRSMSGNPLLMYEVEVPTSDSYYNDIVILALSEEEVSALQVPGKFGVWTG